MPKQKPADLVTPQVFRSPIVSLMPPRRPTGHPVNRIRARILRLIARCIELKSEAETLRAVVPWLLCGIAWLLDTWQVNGELRIQGAFLAAIWAAISLIGTWIASNAVTVAITVGQAAFMVARAIAEFGIILGHLLARVPALLKSFWTSILRPSMTWFFDQIEAFAHWLDDTFAPLVRIINDIRTWVDKFWATYIQPILDAIEITRRALQILEKFGIDLAAKLDAELAKLEDKIMTPILEIRQALNTALNWINRIVTLDGLLQRVMLLQSIARDIKEVTALWWQAVHRALTPGEDEDYQRPVPRVTVSQANVDAREYVLYRRGPDVARIDEHAADLIARMQAAAP